MYEDFIALISFAKSFLTSSMFSGFVPIYIKKTPLLKLLLELAPTSYASPLFSRKSTNNFDEKPEPRYVLMSFSVTKSFVLKPFVCQP